MTKELAVQRVGSTSSNRTFMELKLEKRRKRGAPGTRSNRTFMELKLMMVKILGVFDMF